MECEDKYSSKGKRDVTKAGKRACVSFRQILNSVTEE